MSETPQEIVAVAVPIDEESEAFNRLDAFAALTTDEKLCVVYQEMLDLRAYVEQLEQTATEMASPEKMSEMMGNMMGGKNGMFSGMFG